VKVLFVSILVVLTDQISKLFVKGFSIPFLHLNFQGVSVGQRIHVLGDFFNITFIENPGIAFGIDPGSSVRIFIPLFTLLASIGLIYYLYKNRDKAFIFRISIAFIIGGAIGNLFDRIFYGILFGYAPLFHGRVVDFFNLRMFNFFMFDRIFGNYVFNVADTAVTAGVVLMLFAINMRKKNEAENEAAVEGALAGNKD
jgi:signal peptidase II